MTPGLPRYEYFDQRSATGVIGRGATQEAAFVHAAEAMFALIRDPLALATDESFEVGLTEHDPARALPTWLNLLLAGAKARDLALARFELRRHGARWQGTAWGQRQHEATDGGASVAGACMTGAEVIERSGGWEVRCRLMQ